MAEKQSKTQRVKDEAKGLAIGAGLVGTAATVGQAVIVAVSKLAG